MSIESFSGEYAFLSNFYESYVEFEGIIYPTVEHAYQAAKSLKDSDRRRIAKSKTPSSAKRMGNNVDLRKDWDSVKLGIMRDLLIKKFQQVDLKERLCATGEQKLVEGNWWRDTFWGVCEGVGQNHLGKLLMEIRELIVEGKL